MHMADALLSPAVAATMIAASTGMTGASIVKLKKEDDMEKLPLMAVSAAFVFAAQMINYAIPGTGASGHICGGMLLSALLGPWAGFLSMVVVLAVQCLFFADGGLLALGANCWNMAFYGCFVGYYLIWKPIVGSRLSQKNENALRKRVVLASILGCIISLQLGSFSVVIETSLSGITELPFGIFAAVMQPIHLAIGLIEGLITAAVLTFILSTRPELITKKENSKKKFSYKKLLIIIAIAAALTGGVISLVASDNPDGLEWSLFDKSGLNEDDYGVKSDVADDAKKLQDNTAILPEYSLPENESPLGTMLSGLAGIAIVAACIALLYAILRLIKIPKDGLHPLMKIVATIAFIAVTVSFSKYSIIKVLIMAIYPITFFIVSKKSFISCIRKIWFVMIPIVFVGIFNPFFDKEIIVHIGSVEISGGVISMLTLMLKGFLSLMAGYILMSTTKIEEVCAALRIIHVPKIFVLMLLLTYRYIFEMKKEVSSMLTAYRLRAPRKKGVTKNAWGSFTGALLLRSFDKAKSVYEAMKLRGFDGDFNYSGRR